MLSRSKPTIVGATDVPKTTGAPSAGGWPRDIISGCTRLSLSSKNSCRIGLTEH